MSDYDRWELSWLAVFAIAIVTALAIIVSAEFGWR